MIPPPGGPAKVPVAFFFRPGPPGGSPWRPRTPMHSPCSEPQRPNTPPLWISRPDYPQRQSAQPSRPPDYPQRQPAKPSRPPVYPQRQPAQPSRRPAFAAPRATSKAKLYPAANANTSTAAVRPTPRRRRAKRSQPGKEESKAQNKRAKRSCTSANAGTSTAAARRAPRHRRAKRSPRTTGRRRSGFWLNRGSPRPAGVLHVRRGLEVTRDDAKNPRS